MVPPKPSARKSFLQRVGEKLPHHFTANYWRNNRPFLSFLFFLATVNLVLFIHRAYYFRNFSMLNGFTPNPFYMLSRACGELHILFSNMALISTDSRPYQKTMYGMYYRQFSKNIKIKFIKLIARVFDISGLTKLVLIF